MRKLFALMLALTLGAFTSAFAQDDAWKYEAISVRYGEGPDGIKSTKSNVRWQEWTDCTMSVRIDMDPNSLIIKDASGVVHSIAFSILDSKTDSNPANVLMAGLDICCMDLAAIDWYLYKGQSHYLYLFYDSGYAVEFVMKRL